MRFNRCNPRLAGGTSYQGVVRISRDALEAVLGPPDAGDLYKTTNEWTLVFEDETVATVYDYKGDEWHIGGQSLLAVEHVIDALTRAGFVVGEER